MGNRKGPVITTAQQSSYCSIAKPQITGKSEWTAIKEKLKEHPRTQLRLLALLAAFSCGSVRLFKLLLPS